METAESSERGRNEREEVKVKLKTLKKVMEQCQRALESLNADGLHVDDDDDDENDDDDERENSARSTSSPDHEADEVSLVLFWF